jgi:DsbC/DsbD-like thiol-disulfide interchange protein
VTAASAHLTVQAAASDAVVAPGSRFSIALEITPAKGMHVYAPGTHTYQVVRFTPDGRPWLKAQPLQYPPSEIYHFRPLDERVATYQRAFTLVQDLTILATPEIQKLLAGEKSVTVTGRLEYQACDDKVCYAPSAVPLAFTLELVPLLRP